MNDGLNGIETALNMPKEGRMIGVKRAVRIADIKGLRSGPNAPYSKRAWPSRKWRCREIPSATLSSAMYFNAGISYRCAMKQSKIHFERPVDPLTKTSAKFSSVTICTNSKS